MAGNTSGEIGEVLREQVDFVKAFAWKQGFPGKRASSSFTSKGQKPISREFGHFEVSLRSGMNYFY